MQPGYVVPILFLILGPILWFVGRWIGVRWAQEIVDRRQAKEAAVKRRDVQAAQRALDEHAANQRAVEMQDLKLKKHKKKTARKASAATGGVFLGTGVPDEAVTSGEGNPSKNKPRKKLGLSIVKEESEGEGNKEPQQQKKKSKDHKSRKSRQNTPGMMV